MQTTASFRIGQCTNLVPQGCDPREGTRGSGIIRCRKPGIVAKIELRMPFQRPIRFLPETDYPRASRSFPRIAGSGNEIVNAPEHSRPQGHARCSRSERHGRHLPDLPSSVARVPIRHLVLQYVITFKNSLFQHLFYNFNCFQQL
jgi:hypothetical protein